MESQAEDQEPDTQSTQQATQKVLDPRRIGKQNSGFSDADVADIACILLPSSEAARVPLRELALRASEYTGETSNVEHPGALACEALNHMTHLDGEHAIVVRLSTRFKDPTKGFVFGRSPLRCDVGFNNDKMKRLSNVHFRIYFNDYGVLMLEDLSSNGLHVDGVNLKRKDSEKPSRRTINSGSVIRILMESLDEDLHFLVRIPRREGDYEKAFRTNLKRHMDEVQQLRAEAEEAAKTITPGPAGHVDLFPQTEAATRTPVRGKRRLNPLETTTIRDIEGTEWDGSDKYNRVCRIGKGAFAVVYKVTAKFNGKPYAAKELDKRKFMKNGVLDQKVENEMKIMQRAKHRNIVEYIEHIDYNDRLFIIIMEYVANGDLGDLITDNGALMESVVQDMSSQLLSALAYLHRHNITHRDVKPDNILVSSMTPFIVKLTDFGLSKMVDTEKTFLKTFCGTLLYCAPEVYNEYAQYDEYGHRLTRAKPRRKTLGQRYDHAVDIWSLGGVLYYTLTAKPPFPAKNGISYTELLHQIMTKPLNTNPLIDMEISPIGIDFLTQMLQRRPEQRATTEVLQVHPWLADTDFAGERHGDSPEAEIDDELGQLGMQASQLSLEDQSRSENKLAEEDDDAFEYDTEHGDSRDSEPSFDENNHATDFDRFDSHHEENYTFDPMHMRAQRLFGEVSEDDSAAETPNHSYISVAADNFNRTQIFNPQAQKDSNLPASSRQQPRRSDHESQPPRPSGLSPTHRSTTTSFNDLDNTTFSAEVQDLEGTESQLEMLNMKSLAAPQTTLTTFTTSKRKPSQEAGEDVDSTPKARPAVKRIRSESVHELVSSDEEAEQNLYSQIPALPRIVSSRQIDKPVQKSIYWDARDRKTWHLHYPEMTQLQHDAFTSGARLRGEEFAPGKSPLWDLAMKEFPPAVPSPGTSGSDLSSIGSEWRSDVFGTGNGAPSLRSTDDDLPATLSPGHSSLAMTFTDAPCNRIVASLDSMEGSVLSGISINIDSAMASWGRKLSNTHVFTPAEETKVPKYGFKVLLWKEGYEPSRNFRPWNVPQDDFYFYISTKAKFGIRVNELGVMSVEPEDPKAPSRNWARLYDGDVVVPWRESRRDQSKIKLLFRCSWGGSAQRRPINSPTTLVSAETADRLDASCRKVESYLAKLAEHDRRVEEAHFDASERLRNIDRERLRSQNFEAKRLEACRVKAMRASRRSSPAHMIPPSSAPPNMTAHTNGTMSRQQNIPTLKHAASVVDTRALCTTLEE
ncbi:hypothetical protein BD289DRAFT_447468 [Coniella lustricola]|uniref:Autophagy-related protein 1 n=1 Tax=Coniella lustricola TaxID=2025994 RepID=A0A2T2ZT26_9PEZI|nr:hypothetical protein BD289DRAFT_447468 [Coniella lustricola]